MAINQIERIEDYVKCLQQSKAEAEALYFDLLIGVTQFFRDTDAFKVLEETGIPMLFADKPAGSALRVWVPCCSTGEEAYSIAMLLIEYMEAHGLTHPIQIFATDIDGRAIGTARAGVYPSSIASDVSLERLKRFFTVELGGNAYRIKKHVREKLIFSEQNVIRDPPFSRLDLISCRNFLIYLNKDLQKKLISLFHFALNPGGTLFLGNSENINETALFVPMDHGAKLFHSKKEVSRQAAGNQAFPYLSDFARAVAPNLSQLHKPNRISVRDIVERTLLSREDMSAVLVNERGDILYIHGRVGLYLEPVQGEPQTNNALRMAREGLRYELTAALHQVVGKKESVHRKTIRVKTNNHFEFVNISVLTLPPDGENDYQEDLYLVVFEEASRRDMAEAASLPAEGQREDVRIEALRQQLRDKEEYLQAANEELETANEELSSSNEEMQSINEELQSTNEELETSREELQSINEELTTVNAELQEKVKELTKLNNDMNNMFSGTGVGNVFVDHQLRIMRFTPAATEIINLIEGDIGRPVSHIVSNLIGYNGLTDDINNVLHTLSQKEAEVQTKAGKWYSMRIRPYRTLDNVIEGAVITFVDITELKHAQKALQISEERLRLLTLAGSNVVYRMSPDWRTMSELDGHGFLADTEKSNPDWLDTYIHPDDQEFVLGVIEKCIKEKSTFELEHRVRQADGNVGWIYSKAIPVLDENGEIVEWFGAAGDITARKQAEAEVNRTKRLLDTIFNGIDDHVYLKDQNSKLVMVNAAICRDFGQPAEALIGKSELEFFEDRELAQTVVDNDRRVMDSGDAEVVEENMQFQDGMHTFLSKKVPWRDEQGNVQGLFGISRDITGRKRQEVLLTASELHFRSLFETAQFGILTLDADTGDITGVNRYLTDLLGYSKEQFLMKKIWDIGFFCDVVANREKFYELQQEQYVRYDDLPLETANGRRIDVEFISSVYAENGVKVMQCAVREKKSTEGMHDGKTAG